ncbi:MAG TPA: hypothetical protein VML55_08890 [Planctomycetaceae bacterium]|nr:hypothetical protein [Planctomycetaceae bacterium]
MSLTALLMAAVVSAAPGHTNDAPPLPRGLQKTLEGVVQAYYAGDSAAIWRALAPMLARWSESQVAALDRALAAREVPGVGELLVDVRMSFVQQNLAHVLPEPQIRERMLLLAALGDRMNAILEEQREHPLVAATSDPPDSLAELEWTLWDVHVLRNKLLTAARAAEYAQALAGGVTERIRERLSEEEQTLLATAGAPLPDVQSATEALDELDAELRLNRLDRGLAALEQPQLTEERFMAAWSTQHDAEVLAAFLKNQSEGRGLRRLTRAALTRPGLADEIAAKAERARQLAGDLAEKARHFFVGLHWWRRGRFGQGPELGGLAKSAAAAETPGGLVWLYMPSEPPLPDPARERADKKSEDVADESADQSEADASIDFSTPSDRMRIRQPTPPVERRHHYTWAWEDRRIIPTTGAGTIDQVLSESPTRVGLSRFW